MSSLVTPVCLLSGYVALAVACGKTPPVSDTTGGVATGLYADTLTMAAADAPAEADRPAAAVAPAAAEAPAAAKALAAAKAPAAAKALAAAEAPAADEAPTAAEPPAAALAIEAAPGAGSTVEATSRLNDSAHEYRLMAKAVRPSSRAQREVYRGERVWPELPAGAVPMPGDEETFQAPGVVETVEATSLVLLQDAAAITYEIAGSVRDEVARMTKGSHVDVYFHRRAGGFVADSVAAR